MMRLFMALLLTLFPITGQWMLVDYNETGIGPVVRLEDAREAVRLSKRCGVESLR